MKEQSNMPSIPQQQLSITQLIELYHYSQFTKKNSLYRLSIVDYDINLRQKSDYYVQKRKGNIIHQAKQEIETDKNPEYSKIVKKSKIENIKKDIQMIVKPDPFISKLPTIQQKIQIHINKVTQKQENDDQNEKERQKFKLKSSSRRKIEAVPTKKAIETDKLSAYSLKQFEKTYLEQYSNHLNMKEKEKNTLSQFIQNNKQETISEQGKTISKKAKVQKHSNPIPKTEKSFSNIKNNIISQQEIKNKNDEDNHLEKSKDDIKITQSKVYILPENIRNSSKSKSKTKTKKIKESSFANKSPIKTYIKQFQYSDPIQPKQYFPAYSSPIPQKKKEQKKLKENSIPKKIKIKCEDFTPTEDFQQQLQPDSQYNHKDEIDQFPQQKTKDNKEAQPQLGKENNQKDQSNNFSSLDYYSIPLNKKYLPNQKKQSKILKQPLPAIASDLKQNQESKEVESNLLKKIQNEKTKEIEDETYSKPKSARKKIFQEHDSKTQHSYQQMKDDQTIQLSSLTDEQMRMLLGGKGNKYKQAIILEYIKQNRKCKK